MHAYGVDIEDLARLTPGRIGQLLRDAREASGIDLDAVADRAGLGRRSLKRWERGDGRPTPDEIVRLAAALDLTIDELVPPRSPVVYHPATSTLTVGDRTAAVVQCSSDADGNDAVLRTFIDAVSDSRGCPPASSFALRRDDVAALAQLLHLQDADLEHRLERILGMSAMDAAVLHSRLVSRRTAFAAAASLGLLASIPIAASARGADPAPQPVAVSATTTMTLVMDAPADPPTTLVVHVDVPAPSAPAAPADVTPPTTAPHAVSPVQLPDDADGDGIDIGDALVIERGTPPTDGSTQIGDTVTYER